jgi:hypothetical protein
MVEEDTRKLGDRNRLADPQDRGHWRLLLKKAKAHPGCITDDDSDDDTYWVIALEWWEAVDARQRSGVTDPLNSLPVGHQPYFRHFDNGVQECNKSFFVMWLCEPGSMVKQAKWCPVEYIMSISFHVFYRTQNSQMRRSVILIIL